MITTTSEALTIATRRLVVLLEVRIAILLVALHEAIALADLVRIAPTLIAVVTGTIVAASVELLIGSLLQSLLVARHFTAHVVIVYRARAPLVAIFSAST